MRQWAVFLLVGSSTLLAWIGLPMSSAAADDLERIMMIGETPEGDDSVANALDRHIRLDNFGILATTLKEVVPDTLPDEQFDDLLAAAAVLRDHAQHWQEAGIHHKKGLALTQTIYNIADAVRTRKPKSTDAQLAYANALVALTFERKNRREGAKFDETFGAAAAVCLEAAKLDDARAEQCMLNAAHLLQIGSKYAGSKQLDVLDRALTHLNEIKDGNRGVVKAAKARLYLTRAFGLLRNKKKGDAKKAALVGLALVERGTEPLSPEAAGARNDLLDVAISNKWMPNKTPFEMESATQGGFTFDMPTGTGWHEGNAGNLKGKGRVLVERRRPDGMWVQFGVAAFSEELTYGEGDVSGAKPKAILGLTKQVWSGAMKKPKSGSANKKDVPDGLKCVDSYSLLGRHRSGTPQSVFSWACTGKSKEWMYVITVVVRGRKTKKVPLQVQAMMASLQETADK